MEFIKVGKNYMIKGSNGRIVSEKEKLELENRELIIEDIKSNKCQGKTTQKISRNKKKIKEIENNELNISKAQKELSKKVFEYELKQMKTTNEFAKKYLETAQNKGVSADDIIKETNSTI